MVVLKLYCVSEVTTLLKSKLAGFNIGKIETEICLNVELDASCTALSDNEEAQLSWILSTPFRSPVQKSSTFLEDKTPQCILIEIGPRLNFSTPFSTNAVAICHSIGLTHIQRIEASSRYLIHADKEGDFSEELEASLVKALHDKMTQCRYMKPLESFSLDLVPEEPYEVDIINKGREALAKANTDLGLAFDAWDLDYYTNLFKSKVQRNPTSVECFDLAQSNSEHSRHWFFKGRMFVDGAEMKESLFDMVMATQNNSNQNNIIKFCDNSSAISGYPVKLLYPSDSHKPSNFQVRDDITRHVIFTAETHNFPTGVAPFPGATTGTGGRIRDVHAAGRGAHVIAGTVGYSFGNLNIPGYDLPWEDNSLEYPPNFASPLEIAIEASNGASDYGNKFGEPVLTGFVRSFGLQLPGSMERREYIKPILFSGGIGALDHWHVQKDAAEVGMDVIKLGGPVYRIGVGGGAASSIQVQGDNQSELDFGAVQRGDAEMEQKLNRVIRACVEMGDHNPICSIHDQGAGGNGNVLKEICEPAGALIHTAAFQLGDPTLSVLELWGAEYQESTAVLVRSHNRAKVIKVGAREKCPVSVVGRITGDGKIRLEDDRLKETSLSSEESAAKKSKISNFPVDLDLELVLGKMPRKEFQLKREVSVCRPLELPADLSVQDALQRVLRLPSVASKRFLTNKVDRSVTGLVAQQPCVGPLHTPLADVAVIALSYLDTVGGATAIGEQPIKGLLDPACGARMTVGEALTNLVFARITDLKDVKCSGNWMWPAKLPGEGARLYDTCGAMCDVMSALGVAVDGGKDSLSMAARVGTDTVKAPGTLVVSAYAACPDIRQTVTPDLKCPDGKGTLLYVPLSPGHHRLGGSALAQCYKQIGHSAPDMDDPGYFRSAFNVMQNLIKDGQLQSGHDVSDGGLVTCILEMAFAGNCGLTVDIKNKENASTLEVLFAEELGWVLEVFTSQQTAVCEAFSSAGVHCHVIGTSHTEKQVSLSVSSESCLRAAMDDLRDAWEETSYQLELRQASGDCVRRESVGLRGRTTPQYRVADDTRDDIDAGVTAARPRVAVLREEGSNGDREMCAALHRAGFEVWDVHTNDLCTGAVTLDRFQGLVFVGGFSYADVFGSAKGWAATLKYHSSIKSQLDAFYARPDTFSLGICNGCQLMALLGWVGSPEGSGEGTKQQTVHLAHNLSQRFESRFTTVRIEESPAMMLQGMAGSVLGIWVAHGEGRMVFNKPELASTLLSANLVPVRYTDDAGVPTETYPHNPNGSPAGIAALCSPDGRHLAMMPHPERCVLNWQWAWQPEEWKQGDQGLEAPWMRMFRNAHKWCSEQD